MSCIPSPLSLISQILEGLENTSLRIILNFFVLWKKERESWRDRQRQGNKKLRKGEFVQSKKGQWKTIAKIHHSLVQVLLARPKEWKKCRKFVPWYWWQMQKVVFWLRHFFEGDDLNDVIVYITLIRSLESFLYCLILVFLHFFQAQCSKYCFPSSDVGLSLIENSKLEIFTSFSCLRLLSSEVDVDRENGYFFLISNRLI